MVLHSINENFACWTRLWRVYTCAKTPFIAF